MDGTNSARSAQSSTAASTGRGTAAPQATDAVHRLVLACVGVAAIVTIAEVAERLLMPAAAAEGDPVGRLALLGCVLAGGALLAASSFRVLSSQSLVAGGMVFVIAGSFLITVADATHPLPGVSIAGLPAAALIIAGVGSVLPAAPGVVLAVGAAAATAWLLGYGVNTVRLGLPFDTMYAAVWSVPNYGAALLAFAMVRAAHPDDEGARELGSYELVELIGEGGMGEVWRARHQMLARPAAVKIIKSGVGNDVGTARFRREANIIASLQSPHTVYLYDFGTTTDGRLYYVMELLKGMSLQGLVTKHGPQPPQRVIAILRQVCQSLEEAHQRAFVHRDLKPSNVMLCRIAGRYDFVKVLDFGLARAVAVDTGTQLTAEGIVIGTPEYMAPEVALGNAKVDARADIYAVGCLAYVLLTGSLVFDDENPLKLALRHVRDQPAPPSTRTDRPIPPALEAIVMQCLKKHPPARPSSARALEEMLAACDAGSWTADDAAAWWEQHEPGAFPRSVPQPQSA